MGPKDGFLVTPYLLTDGQSDDCSEAEQDRRKPSRYYRKVSVKMFGFYMLIGSIYDCNRG